MKHRGPAEVMGNPARNAPGLQAVNQIDALISDYALRIRSA